MVLLLLPVAPTRLQVIRGPFHVPHVRFDGLYVYTNKMGCGASKAICQGVTVIPYKTLSEALVNLRRCLAQQEPKPYYHPYFDKTDYALRYLS
ncbi:hypothetical protein NKDENANG_03538 [Candidatus Entotheonellaceae bacterium PAL068K]